MTEHLSSNSFQSLVLYSEKDESYKSDIESHLKLASLKDFLGKFKYLNIEKNNFLAGKIDSIIDDTTTIICLVSHYFISSDFGLSNELKALNKAHNLKKTRIIPIFIDTCNIQFSPLNKVERLNTNKTPLIQANDNHYNHFLSLLTLELTNEILKVIEYEKQLEEDWQTAKNENSIKGFNTFIKTYPYSKYKRDARLIKNNLIEEKLWKEAVSFDKIEYFVNYLSNSPLKKHTNKAIVKIIDIESSEAIAKNDIEKSKNLGVLFNYKLKFRNSAEIDKVNEKMYKVLTQPLELWLNAEKLVESESDLLRYKIYKNCKKKEIFNFNLLEEVSNGVKKKLTALEKKLSSSQSSLVTLIVLFILLFSINALLLSLLESTIIETIFAYRILFILFGLYLILKVWSAFQRIASDIKSCKEKLKLLLKKSVELKISFINFDKKNQGKIILFLFNTEEWVEEINNKNLMSYFRDSSDDTNIRKKQNAIEEKMKSFENKIQHLQPSI